MNNNNRNIYYISLSDVASILMNYVGCGVVSVPYLDIRYFAHIVIKTWEKEYGKNVCKIANEFKEYDYEIGNYVKNGVNTDRLKSCLIASFLDNVFGKVYGYKLRIGFIDHGLDYDFEKFYKNTKDGIVLSNICGFDDTTTVYDLGVPGTYHTVINETYPNSDEEFFKSIDYTSLIKTFKDVITELNDTLIKIGFGNNRYNSVNGPYITGWKRCEELDYDYRFIYTKPNVNEGCGFTPFTSIKDKEYQMIDGDGLTPFGIVKFENKRITNEEL